MPKFFIHKVKNKWTNVVQLNSFLEKAEPGMYSLEINKSDRRSTRQNRYYWGVVIPLVMSGIADCFGEEITDEEAHDYLKMKFNSVNDIPRSTTGLNKDQFKTYIEKIQRFGSEFLNVSIPDPGQQLEIETT